MNIKTVWGVYFSATGTTEKVVKATANALAKLLGAVCELRSFNLPKTRETAMNFGPEDAVILGVPVYAGRVPNLLLPYVRDMIHGNGALGIPIVLYGNRNFDDGLIELRDCMEQNGFHTIAAGAFVGEHSFSRTLGAGRPDAEDMQLADLLSKRAADWIKAFEAQSRTDADLQAAQAHEASGNTDFVWPFAPVCVDGCEPIRPYYTPRDRHGNPINILKVKPKTDPAKCIHCGLCAAICPMGSIDPTDVSQVPGKCIKCCACVKRCPTGAKYYDDEGYLYHQHELEDVYGERRAESRIYGLSL